MKDYIYVNDNRYLIVSFLGKGKSGYSYLATKDNQYFVLKQIHHEPCDYYQFGDKLNAEINAYHRLLEIKIPIPKLIEIDYKKEIIVKQYIDGPTIAELIKKGIDISVYLNQLKSWLPILYSNNINIDYYPTNFVIDNSQIYYIDYEYNTYDLKWNFENWGMKYWLKIEPIE